VEFPTEDPTRWETIRFATPRGDMVVTAHGLNRSLLVSLQRLGLCLLAFAGALLPFALVMLLKRAIRGGAKSLGRVLFIAGLISVFFGILPVVGALLWLVALVLKATTPFHRLNQA
jgi:hypothetical protein